MGAARGMAGEGRLKTLLAVMAAGVVFPCWLTAPSVWDPSASGGWMLFPSAHPTTLEFMRWTGAGVMAGVVAACIAPRRRWIMVPPLVISLEAGWAILVFLIVGAGDVPRPPGTFQGMLAGVVLGVAAIAVIRPGARLVRRLATIGLAAAVLLSAPLISAWRGRADLAAMRQTVLPMVERLLRADLLHRAGPVRWFEVRRKRSDDGALYWRAYGEMREPQAQIALDWHGDPSRWAAGASGRDALRVERMEVNLVAPQPFDAVEFDRRHDAAATRQLLQSMGVRRELTARIELRKEPESANWYAVAVYHGINYKFDWHVFPSYEFARIHFAPDTILTTCSGTYRGAAP